MSEQSEMISVNAENVEKTGFFCMKSKPKSAGYRLKADWLRRRFDEGMRIRLMREGERWIGFIEYIPGEFAWRAVDAPDYMVIHCLWVVGKGKGQGYGTRLLESCLEDARRSGMRGVVMVASEATWLAGRDLFLRYGFSVVDTAAPSFSLLVHSFDASPPPSFPTDWERRRADCGPGMTVMTSDQCPYLETVEGAMMDAAHARGMAFQTIRLESSQEVRQKAVSPYGVFGVVCNGRLLTYHWEPDQQLSRLIDGAMATTA